MKRSIAKFLVLLLFIFAFPQNVLPVQPPNVGLESIREESLRGTLTFLASSELQGRETATHGQKVAALYISTVFTELGLKPIGTDGTYFQRFNLEVRKLGKNTSIAVKRKSGETKVYDKVLSQFLFLPRGQNAQSVTAPLAFVGYGITSPDTEYNYNDYADIDVKGKIVLMMGYEPQEKDSTSIFNGTKPTRFSGRRAQQVKAEIAKLNGATGVLYVSEVGDHPGLATFGRFLGDALTKGTMALPDTASSTQTGIPVFSISKEVANEILQPSGRTIDEIHAKIDQNLEPQSFEVLETEITLNVDVQKETVQSENVAGLLEGTDPSVKNEVVVFSAHYDHLGVGNNGEVYHGADDDGSGTTAVLEIARAFSRNPEKPKRSVLFLAFTGEEKGLLGSEYYTNYPLLPLQNTVADLNADMIGRIDPIYENTPDSANFVFVIGAAKLSSELKTTLEEANRETVNMKLDYRYDDPNDPNQYYRRSDHFNFARKGVPIAFFSSGTHKDYHRPTDTVEKINFQKMAKTVKLIYATGWALANAPHRPVIDGDAAMYR
jgi:hypothetical protein